MTDFHYMFKCVFFTCERCNHQNLFFLLDSKWCVLRTACFKKRAIQQLSLLWTETYQYRNFRSIQYELQRWESKKCIVPIQICIKMWSIMGCACCHGFEWISCFSGARASFFFLFSFISFFLPMTVVRFLRYISQIQLHMLSISLLHDTSHKAILHCHASVLFSGAALLLHWGHLCPTVLQTVGMKLASEERGNLWRDNGETHPLKKAKPRTESGRVWQAPCDPGPLGCLPSSWWWWGVLLLTSLWSVCPSWLVQSPIRGYWLWPANIHQVLCTV